MTQNGTTLYEWLHFIQKAVKWQSVSLDHLSALQFTISVVRINFPGSIMDTAFSLCTNCSNITLGRVAICTAIISQLLPFPPLFFSVSFAGGQQLFFLLSTTCAAGPAEAGYYKTSHKPPAIINICKWTSQFPVRHNGKY